VRVDYYGAEPEGASSAWVPTKIASEWICVEHEGFAGSKATGWWARHVGTKMPANVAEAVERLKAGEMRRVVKIETKPDGDYTRVVRLVQEAGRQPGADDDAGEAPAVALVDPLDGDDLPF
jgi:DNA repair protein RadD